MHILPFMYYRTKASFSSFCFDFYRLNRALDHFRSKEHNIVIYVKKIPKGTITEQHFFVGALLKRKHRTVLIPIFCVTLKTLDLFNIEVSKKAS